MKRQRFELKNDKIPILVLMPPDMQVGHSQGQEQQVDGVKNKAHSVFFAVQSDKFDCFIRNLDETVKQWGSMTVEVNHAHIYKFPSTIPQRLSRTKVRLHTLASPVSTTQKPYCQTDLARYDGDETTTEIQMTPGQGRAHLILPALLCQNLQRIKNTARFCQLTGPSVYH